MLRITSRDVGLTQVATIWLYETKIIEFYTATRHVQSSEEIAEIVLAKALESIIGPVLAEQGCRLYTGEWDFDADS